LTFLADVLRAAVLATLLLAAPAAAAEPPPAPVSPANGQVFAWEDVELSGVKVVVQAPPGEMFVDVDVARSPAMTDSADWAMLREATPGRYEGEVLTLLWDEDSDPGVYYWRPYYYGAFDPNTGDVPKIYGPIRSLTVKRPYAAPALSVAIPSKLYAGRGHHARVRYRPGSEPGNDHLYVIESRSRCPASPGAGKELLDRVAPPTAADMDIPVRSRRLGRVWLCGYVTSGATVTRRASDAAEVVRRPISRSRMRRWRLTADGMGALRIGMTVGEIERTTGRAMIFGYGDYRSCELWELRGAPRGLSLMVAYGRLARVEAWRGSWRTARGIRIGDTESKVRRRYRVSRSEPHPYTPPGKYLWVGSGKRRMIFTTSPEGRVTSFRGGKAREVGYIEGCV
jgi:hypothetical protein